MADVMLMYVGPHDEVEIVETGQTCRRDETVTVAPAVAGRAPKGSPGEDGYEPGSGLLDQPDNWQPVLAPPAPEPDPTPENGK